MLRLNVIALKTSVLRFSEISLKSSLADQVPRVNHSSIGIFYLHSVWEPVVPAFNEELLEEELHNSGGISCRTCRAEEARQMGGEPWNASGSSGSKGTFFMFYP